MLKLSISVVHIFTCQHHLTKANIIVELILHRAIDKPQVGIQPRRSEAFDISLLIVQSHVDFRSHLIPRNAPGIVRLYKLILFT